MFEIIIFLQCLYIGYLWVKSDSLANELRWVKYQDLPADLARTLPKPFDWEEACDYLTDPEMP